MWLIKEQTNLKICVLRNRILPLSFKFSLHTRSFGPKTYVVDNRKFVFREYIEQEGETFWKQRGSE